MDGPKRRLLITGSTFPRWQGDTEPRFVLDFAKEMTKYFDVTVAVPAAIGAKDDEVLEGVKVHRYHYLPIHKWETLAYPGAIVPRIKENKVRILQVPFLLFGLWNYLRKNRRKFDVVHSHWLIPQGVVQSFFSTPYLVTGHGGDVTGLNKGVVKKWKAKALKNASAITFVSPQLKAVADRIPEYQLAMLDKQNEIIPMGVDTKIFSNKFHMDNYFGQGNKKVVLYVGRLVEYKGLRYLIEAMEDVDGLLVVVGSGPMREEYERLTEPIKEKIQFLGPKTHDELKVIYASADIFCIPSYTTEKGEKEGFGLVSLEAMASGLPVVASDCGGLSTIVRDGYNGYLVQEKDSRDMALKINALLHNEEQRNQLGRNALLSSKRFDYEALGLKYKALLDQCIIKN